MDTHNTIVIWNDVSNKNAEIDVFDKGSLVSVNRN